MTRSTFIKSLLAIAAAPMVSKMYPLVKKSMPYTTFTMAVDPIDIQFLKEFKTFGVLQSDGSIRQVYLQWKDDRKNEVEVIPVEKNDATPS